MIYSDPTEFRVDSVIGAIPPENIKILPGLEGLTGADFAIFPSSSALFTNLSQMPQRIRFENEVQSAILVQRKTGKELLESFPKLGDILFRMLSVKPVAAYLFELGIYEIVNSTVFVDNAPTGWNDAAFIGATIKWQMRGGHIINPTSIEQFFYYLNYMDHVVNETWETVSKPLPTSGDPKIDFLSYLPGIGPELARSTLDFTGQLYMALMALSNKDIADGKKSLQKIKQIGPKKVKAIRQFLDIPEDAYGLGLYIDE